MLRLQKSFIRRQIIHAMLNPRGSLLPIGFSDIKKTTFLKRLFTDAISQHRRDIKSVSSITESLQQRSWRGVYNVSSGLHHIRYKKDVASVTLNTDDDVIRFCVEESPHNKFLSSTKVQKMDKLVKRMSRKKKLNELRFYRLKAKRKIKSPNPLVRIRYKLGKALRKEEWLIEKLMKFDIPMPSPEAYDPEILTAEEKFYIKRIGEKKKHYVPLGRRGVFGGVVLNMHLHWKKHETVKVICRPCRPGQVHEYAERLAELSKGIVIDIKANNTILFYRGKNYVQPKIMSPLNTLSKAKALAKYKFEQSLEHTSEFIEKLEKELEEYSKHVAQYRTKNEMAMEDSRGDRI